MGYPGKQKMKLKLLAFFLTLGLLSGSKSPKGRSAKLINQTISFKKTVADSSNSDTTSSEDSDSWSQAKEHKVDYFKTQRDYKRNISSREKNLKRCASWDMEAAIGNISDNPWAKDPDDDGEKYYPLEIEEPEDQINPQSNVVARIMTQYRKDLGFNTVGDFIDIQDDDLVLEKFFSCLESRPKKFDHEREERRQSRRERRQMRRQALKDSEAQIKAALKDEIAAKLKADRKIRKRRKRMEKLSEAYYFLKFVGKIPQFTGETLNLLTCDEIRVQSGNLRYFQDLRELYKTELNYYTFLNWDYLDLTHFAFQNFPIIDQITREITYIGNSQVVSPPVLMSKGVNVLAAYEDFIRFHNPRTLEGRRQLLFQKLYSRYYALMGERAYPTFIDWDSCKVSKWPSKVDKSNIEAWTEDDVLLLEALLTAGKLVFTEAEKVLKDRPDPLGMTDSFYDRSVIQVHAEEVEGSDCAVSDDEKICGKPSRTIEEAKEKAKANKIAALAKKK